MRFNSNILYLLVVFLLSSCLKEYQVDLKGQNILSLNSEIKPDDTIKALITLPKKPDWYGDFVTPANAKVFLLEDGVFFDSLYYKPDVEGQHGIYISKKFPKEDKLYTIHVSVDGFTSIQATQKIFEKPKISNVTFNKYLQLEPTQDTIWMQVNLLPTNEITRFFTFNIAVYAEWWERNDQGLYEIKSGYFPVELINSEEIFRDMYWEWSLPPITNNIVKVPIILPERSTLPNQIKNAQLTFTISEIPEDGHKYRVDYYNRYKDNYGENRIIFSNIENGLGIFTSKSTTYHNIPFQ